jgi:hypothetical protein
LSERASLLRPPAIPEIEARERLAWPRLTIAVVDGLPCTPLASHLARAPGAVRARMVLRNKPGFDLGAGSVASHPDAWRDAARALLDSLPPHDLLVAEGAPLLACSSPRLAILGTLSPSLLALDPDVRALRPRFDLVLHDFRSGVLDRIAAALHA